MKNKLHHRLRLTYEIVTAHWTTYIKVQKHISKVFTSHSPTQTSLLYNELIPGTQNHKTHDPEKGMCSGSRDLFKFNEISGNI